MIFAVSSIPGEDLSTLPAPDYIMHTIEYSGLGILLCWWRLAEGERPLKALVQAVILGCLYGITDEFHQYFVPGRSTSVSDWLADTVGTTAGASIALMMRHIYSQVLGVHFR